MQKRQQREPQHDALDGALDVRRDAKRHLLEVGLRTGPNVELKRLVMKIRAGVRRELPLDRGLRCLAIHQGERRSERSHDDRDEQTDDYPPQRAPARRFDFSAGNERARHYSS